MTTKVEPTVEKWEEKAREIIGEAMAWDFGKGVMVGIVPELENEREQKLKDVVKKILNFLAHSVQEAKEEERKEGNDWLNEVDKFYNPPENEYQKGYKKAIADCRSYGLPK